MKIVAGEKGQKMLLLFWFVFACCHLPTKSPVYSSSLTGREGCHNDPLWLLLPVVQLPLFPLLQQLPLHRLLLLPLFAAAGAAAVAAAAARHTYSAEYVSTVRYRSLGEVVEPGPA